MSLQNHEQHCQGEICIQLDQIGICLKFDTDDDYQ